MREKNHFGNGKKIARERIDILFENAIQWADEILSAQAPLYPDRKTNCNETEDTYPEEIPAYLLRTLPNYPEAWNKLQDQDSAWQGHYNLP
jgi:hypothetical protein